MKAPFPWYGGKSRVAPEVWAALGDVQYYVEPFAGSLAVLLARPASHKHKLWSRTDVERIQPRPESFLFEAGGNLFYDRHALKKTPLQAPD
jgi:hypothetical protein